MDKYFYPHVQLYIQRSVVAPQLFLCLGMEIAKGQMCFQCRARTCQQTYHAFQQTYSLQKRPEVRKQGALFYGLTKNTTLSLEGILRMHFYVFFKKSSQIHLQLLTHSLLCLILSLPFCVPGLLFSVTRISSHPNILHYHSWSHSVKKNVFWLSVMLISLSRSLSGG